MSKSKQYGLKVIHKPSNTVASEKWFNTELERNTAMGGTKLEPGYIFYLEEKEIEKRAQSRPGEWAGPL